MRIVASTPASRNAAAYALTMSPRPPVFASGTASEATSKTFKDKGDSWRLMDEKRWDALRLEGSARIRPVLLSEGRRDAGYQEQGVCQVLRNLQKSEGSDRP